MSVRDLLRILRRNLIVMTVCLVAGMALGGIAALRQPAYYTTQARLFVSGNGSDSTDTLLQNSNLVLDRVPSYVTLVNSPLVLNQVAQRLGRTESVQSMAARITATNPLQTALIEITVRDTTAQRAYELAVAVSAAVMSVVPRVEATADGVAPIKITLVSQPDLPTHANLGPAGYRLALGILLGLLLGTVIAVGRELLNARLEDPEQLRTRLNLAPLGVLADSGRAEVGPLPPDDAYWASRAGEGYRQLRNNVRVLTDSGGLRSIVVTGPHADDGAATVAQNLAVALSLIRVRVLLVESDLRHPRLAETFGINGAEPARDGPTRGEPTRGEPAPDVGLSAVLAGGVDVDKAIRRWRDGTLHLLPAGSDTGAAGELLASDAMRHLLGRLEQRFDLLIVSAPPLLEVADAAALAAAVDGVLLTARRGSTRWTAVRQSVQALHDARARVLGAAVLGRTRSAGHASPDALPVAVASNPTSGPATSGPATAGPATDGPATDRPATDRPATSGPAMSEPTVAASRNDGPPRITEPTLPRRPVRRLSAPPRSPAPSDAGFVPRQLAPARGVAAVRSTVDTPANNRTPNNSTDDPDDREKWA